MELLHILNRGVDKRRVFEDEKDYVRFIHDLYVFNDVNATPNYVLKKRNTEYERRLLVYVHAFCLMPNHYHLLLSPLQENGISLFMKKINMGYAKYFNEKYDRSGTLWQGKYKKILITSGRQELYIPYYIHLNPLDLKMPEWRYGKIKKSAKALELLSQYRWSSHLDYSGTKNFPSIINTSFLVGILGKKSRYENEIKKIITDENLAAQSALIEN